MEFRMGIGVQCDRPPKSLPPIRGVVVPHSVARDKRYDLYVHYIEVQNLSLKIMSVDGRCPNFNQYVIDPSHRLRIRNFRV